MIMANLTVIKLANIGEVMFERSNKAKYVNISVRPFKGIRVAVPSGVSIEKARKIAETKSGWMKTQLYNNKRMEREHNEFIRREAPMNREDAKKKIINRLKELSKRHNIQYNKVFIRTQKTRWGSCSAKKNISLNINIARLPGKLMDYVILHELVHIRHSNHGKKYWQELNSIIGNAKTLDKQLDNYRLLLVS
jgi:predicted metal-dependent hydrolase